jgi:ABC-type sugar transport system ATPase subunit
MNLIDATWHGDQVDIGGVSHAVGAVSAEPRDVVLGVRPGELRAGASGIEARVEYVEELGDHCIADLLAGTQRLKMKADGDAALRLREGATVRLSFDPAAAHLFERGSGRRLN